MSEERVTRDQMKHTRRSASAAPPVWDDIDAELSCSVREAGVGCGTMGTTGTFTDSAMAAATANLREAVKRRRPT